MLKLMTEKYKFIHISDGLKNSVNNLFSKLILKNLYKYLKYVSFFPAFDNI